LLVSGLAFKWEGMDAVYIGDSIIPQEFLNLNWHWESLGNYSKLLGFHFGTGLDPDMMMTHINSLLEARLVKSQMNPTSMSARLVIEAHDGMS
jgi:hypothetical protein